MNHEKELRLADVMSDNISKDPVELGVPQRLCLDEKVRSWTGRDFPLFYNKCVVEQYLSDVMASRFLKVLAKSLRSFKFKYPEVKETPQFNSRRSSPG